jgi:Asp-tRNA(Asn)/Glu-tRNA(Gln) amidotransferase A subunit family amidase
MEIRILQRSRTMQIVGRAFDEATVLRIAAAFEAATGLNVRRPPLAQKTK